MNCSPRVAHKTKIERRFAIWQSLKLPDLRRAGRKTVVLSLKRADLRTAGRKTVELSLKTVDLRTADCSMAWHFTDNRWLFGGIFCKVAGFLNKKDKNASY